MLRAALRILLSGVLRAVLSMLLSGVLRVVLCAVCCADGVVLIVLLQAAASLVSNRQLQYSNSNKIQLANNLRMQAIIQHICEGLRRLRYTAAATANLVKCRFDVPSEALMSYIEAFYK